MVSENTTYPIRHPMNTTRQPTPSETATAPNEWTAGVMVGVIWNVLGAVISVLAGLSLVELYRLTHPAVLAAEQYDLDPLVVGAVLTVLLIGLVVGHELVHGVAMRAFGAVPRYGIHRLGGWMPLFYCTARGGHTFTKNQFSLVALAPGGLITLVGALLVVLVPFGGWLILPLALHLGGCIGHLWVIALVRQQPGGTLVEDLPSGLRFHAV